MVEYDNAYCALANAKIGQKVMPVSHSEGSGQFITKKELSCYDDGVKIIQGFNQKWKIIQNKEKTIQNKEKTMNVYEALAKAEIGDKVIPKGYAGRSSRCYIIKEPLCYDGGASVMSELNSEWVIEKSKVPVTIDGE